MVSHHHGSGTRFVCGDRRTRSPVPASPAQLFERLLAHKCSTRYVFRFSAALAAAVSERNIHEMATDLAKKKVGYNEHNSGAAPLPAADGPAPHHRQFWINPERVPAPAAKRAAKKPAGKIQRKLDQVEADRLAEAWDVPDESASDFNPRYDTNFEAAMKEEYTWNKAFSKIVGDLPAYPAYRLEGGFQWQEDSHWGPRLCIPKSKMRGRSIQEVSLEHTHEVAGQGGAAKMLAALTQHCLRPTITKDTVAFCASCPPCQA